MIDWQLTAKTIYCVEVDDEVTLMVYQDESAVCTGYNKYSQPNSLTARTIREKTSKLKRSIKCKGKDCPRILEYRQKILAEEPR